ncbi:MAG: hypothetical protein NTX22_16935 [Ignavibacteriales bacterium]|nr:hypothetical protein [Ignavibacteriales bacterium]
MKINCLFSNRINFKSFVVVILVSFITTLPGCKLSDKDLLAPSEEYSVQIPVSIAKWYDDHKAAMSLTEDHGWWNAEINATVTKLILDYGLTMDFDLVTFEVQADSIHLNYVRNNLLPKGFGFFGHGHKHDNHDKLSYEQSLASFKKCYESMIEIGVKPVAYAYPGGWGFFLKTRTALKDAGFLCGRRFDELDNVLDPYIMPDTSTQPADWFALPSLTMQSVDFQGNVTCVNNTSELIAFLDEAVQKRAWLISTYHFIGNKSGWGYYELPEFENDLRAIKSRDIWCTHLADVVLYSLERKNANAIAMLVNDKYDSPVKIKISLADGLPNDYYNQPLTIKLEIPNEWIGKEIVLLSGKSIQQIFKFESKQIQVSILPNDLKDNYILQLK